MKSPSDLPPHDGPSRAAGKPNRAKKTIAVKDGQVLASALSVANSALNTAVAAVGGALPDTELPKAFPIVGIGASAGGLAAFEAFFSGMPADTDPGMAFVLVQHLAPDHKSILSDLIRRYTRMQVSEVEDGMVVQPNCAYIIPPARDMAFLNGKLQLLEPSMPRGQRLPIDFFFPFARARSTRTSHWHRALRHWQRRHAGRARHQGRGRHGHGPKPQLH